MIKSILPVMLMALVLGGCVIMRQPGGEAGDDGEDQNGAEAREEASSAAPVETRVDNVKIETELTAEVKAKQALAENLTVQIEELRKKVAADQEELQNIGKSKLAVQKEIEDLRFRQQLVVKEKLELDRSKDLLKDDNDKLLTENRILLKHLSDTKKEHEDLKNTYASDRKTFAVIKESITAYNDKMEKDKLKGKQVAGELADLEKNKEKLVKEISALKEATSLFEAQKEQLRQKIGSLQKAIANFESWQVFDKEEPGPGKKSPAAPPPPSAPAAPAADRPAVEPEKAAAVPAQPAAPKPVPLKKATCPLVEDAFIVEARPTENKGATQGLVVGYSKDHKNLRTVLKFDLAGLPAGSKISKALLSCYCYAHQNSREPLTIGAYLAGAPWQENAVNWDGVSFLPAPAAATTVDNPETWYDWNITELVREWQENKKPNNGLLLKTETEGGTESNYLSFKAKENREAVPVLKIEYY